MDSTKKLNPINYLKEAREELNKVSWPSKKETLRYSGIVVGFCVLLAFFFTIIDWALTLGLNELIKINS